MDIKLVGISVDDQSRALAFYTEILGFHKVHDIDLGEFRWLTVTSKGSGETQLSLEPNAHPLRRPSSRNLYRWNPSHRFSQ